MHYRVVFDNFYSFEEYGYPEEAERCIYIHKSGRIDSGCWTKKGDRITKNTAGFATAVGFDLAEDVVAWAPLVSGKSQNIEEMLDIKEGATMEEYLSVMTDALEEAMQVQNKYAVALKELMDENQFLADVITENGLSRKVTDKRKQREQVNNIVERSDNNEWEYLSLDERIEIANRNEETIDINILNSIGITADMSEQEIKERLESILGFDESKRK